MQRVKRRAGQESVWDYPRPPRIEPARKRLKIELGGEIVAETSRAYRVLETSHPPVYFIPPEDVRVGGGKVAVRAAWAYPRPTRPARDIAHYIAFYAGPMDRCTVDDETVTPQPGGFYGGWITSDVVGPFKGSPGTEGW